jgi:hypothetical protein
VNVIAPYPTPTKTKATLTEQLDARQRLVNAITADFRLSEARY